MVKNTIVVSCRSGDTLVSGSATGPGTVLSAPVQPAEVESAPFRHRLTAGNSSSANLTYAGRVLDYNPHNIRRFVLRRTNVARISGGSEGTRTRSRRAGILPKGHEGFMA